MRKSTSGFTIVELLIVIVIIGILAAITIVAYNGIQNRAYDTTVQSDLQNLATKLGLYAADKGSYPTAGGLTSIADLKLTKTAYALDPTTLMNLTYCYENSSTPTTYAILAMSKSGKKFMIANSGSVTDYTPAWTTNSGTNCTAVSASLSLNYNGYLSTDTTTGPWRSWTGN